MRLLDFFGRIRPAAEARSIENPAIPVSADGFMRFFGISNGNIPAVTIDNARGQHTAALAASSVLRLRAQLLLDGVVVFGGAVQSVGVGAEISIDIEA